MSTEHVNYQTTRREELYIISVVAITVATIRNGAGIDNDNDSDSGSDVPKELDQILAKLPPALYKFAREYISEQHSLKEIVDMYNNNVEHCIFNSFDRFKVHQVMELVMEFAQSIESQVDAQDFAHILHLRMPVQALRLVPSDTPQEVLDILKLEYENLIEFAIGAPMSENVREIVLATLRDCIDRIVNARALPQNADRAQLQSAYTNLRSFYINFDKNIKERFPNDYASILSRVEEIKAMFPAVVNMVAKSKKPNVSPMLAGSMLMRIILEEINRSPKGVVGTEAEIIVPDPDTVNSVQDDYARFIAQLGFGFSMDLQRVKLVFEY